MTSYLIQALSDQAPEVRLASVRVLAELGEPKAIEPLTKLLETETSALVDRATIIEAIEALRGGEPEVSSTEAAPTEVAAVDDRRESGRRTSACRGSGKRRG